MVLNYKFVRNSDCYIVNLDHVFQFNFNLNKSELQLIKYQCFPSF